MKNFDNWTNAAFELQWGWISEGGVYWRPSNVTDQKNVKWLGLKSEISYILGVNLRESWVGKKTIDQNTGTLSKKV